MKILVHRCRSYQDLLSANEIGAVAEFDVSETLDGVPIVYHPGGILPDLTKMEWDKAWHKLYGIITLEMWLDYIQMLPELECCLDIKQNSERLVTNIVEAVLRHELEDRIYLTAFQKRIPLPFIRVETNAHILMFAKRLESRVKIHLISTWPWNLPRVADKYRPDAISFGWLLEPRIVRIISKFLFQVNAIMRDLPEQVRRLKKMNIKVWSGICNDPEGMLYLMEMGVDGIMTDNPEILKIVRKTKKTF